MAKDQDRKEGERYFVKSNHSADKWASQVWRRIAIRNRKAGCDNRKDRSIQPIVDGTGRDVFPFWRVLRQACRATDLLRPEQSEREQKA